MRVLLVIVNVVGLVQYSRRVSEQCSTARTAHYSTVQYSTYLHGNFLIGGEGVDFSTYVCATQCSGRWVGGGGGVGGASYSSYSTVASCSTVQ